MSRRSNLVYAAPVFAALGDPTRLDVLARLCAHGPQSIASLAGGANVSRQAVTKHLQQLSTVGLVRDSWRGRERIWELEPKQIAVAQAWLAEISARWDAAIDRLRAFVEDTER